MSLNKFSPESLIENSALHVWGGKTLEEKAGRKRYSAGPRRWLFADLHERREQRIRAAMIGSGVLKTLVSTLAFFAAVIFVSYVVSDKVLAFF